MEKVNKKELFFRETLKLIYKKGFKATTMRDIAENLGFEVANIYNYIESKDSLLENYILNMNKEFHIHMDHILESTYSPSEKLRLVISKHVRFTLERPYELGLIVNEWRNLKEPSMSEYKFQRNSYIYKISTIIENGIEQGEFRPMNIKITTNTIIASLRWSYNRFTGEEESMVNPIEIEKYFTDFVFRAIRAD